MIEPVFKYPVGDELSGFLELTIRNPEIEYLLNRLYFLVPEIFGKATLEFSIFKDFQENWSNLRITIKSDFEVEKVIELEEKLFEKLEENKKLVKALKHVTICCEPKNLAPIGILNIATGIF